MQWLILYDNKFADSDVVLPVFTYLLQFPIIPHPSPLSCLPKSLSLPLSAGSV